MNMHVDFNEILRFSQSIGASPKIVDKAIDSSIKSGLFHIKNKLKDAVLTNEFGWPQIKSFPSTKIFLRVLYTQHKEKKGPMLNAFLRGQEEILGNEYGEKRKRTFFGKLFNVIGYHYEPESKSGEVGIVKTNKHPEPRQKVKEIWKKLQAGFTKPVYDNIRRFFAAIGLPIRESTAMFKIPARPLFGPVAQKRTNEVTGLIIKTIKDKIANNLFKTDFLDRAFGGSR